MLELLEMSSELDKAKISEELLVLNAFSLELPMSPSELELIRASEELLVALLLELRFTIFFLTHRFGCHSSSPSASSVTLLSRGLTRTILVCAPFMLVRVATMFVLVLSVVHSAWSNVYPLGARMDCSSVPVLSAIRIR